MMRSSSRFTAVLVLLALGLNLIPAPLVAAPARNAEAFRPVCQDIDTRTVTLAGGKSVEVIKGERAMAHLRNLRSRRPEVFARSDERLRARGWVPTERVIVFRTVRDQLAGLSGVVQAAEVVAGSDEGEVTFWSWDDGNSGTWEGEMFAVRYADGAEAASDGQIDVSTQNHYVIWEENFYMRTGGPIDKDPLGSAPTMTSSALQPVNSRLEPTAKVSDAKFIQDWLACIVTNCVVILMGCVWAGPMYVECVFGMCHAAVIGCALGEIVRRLW